MSLASIILAWSINNSYFSVAGVAIIGTLVSHRAPAWCGSATRADPCFRQLTPMTTSRSVRGVLLDWARASAVCVDGRGASGGGKRVRQLGSRAARNDRSSGFGRRSGRARGAKREMLTRSRFFFSWASELCSATLRPRLVGVPWRTGALRSGQRGTGESQLPFRLCSRSS